MVIRRSPMTGIGPVIGYRGFQGHVYELGFTSCGVGHGIVGWEATFLTNLKSGTAGIKGASAGFYVGFATFEWGINGSFYSQNSRLNSFIRPNIGLGLGGIATLTYGYNFTIRKNYFDGAVNKHEFRAVIRLPIEVLF